MGFVVRRTNYKKRSWRIALQDRTGGKAKDTHIPEERFREMGILPSMTFEEVRDRIRSLNAQEALKRRAAERAKIDAKLKEEHLAHIAYLPEADLLEFERDILFSRTEDKKIKSHWKVVKDCLCQLKIPPEDWEMKAGKFYDYFAKHKYSVSYIQKLIPLLNKWGKFQARRYRLAFLELPYPKQKDLALINKAYRSNNPKGNAPEGLSPKMLEEKKSELKEAQYRWLFVSIWFGLRPVEVDAISRGELYEIRQEEDQEVLAVFQTKLASTLPEDQCWKLIPVVYPEQKKALEYIKEGLQRPWASTLAKKFGPRIGLRSGRKNFTDMMLDRGHPLEDISAWLGHTSIQRTWKHYRDRKKARNTPKAA